MTLVTRNKPPVHHKKLYGEHHRRSKTYHKPYWPYLPMLAIVAAGFVLNSLLPAKHLVLGYATDMSIQSLLDGTNTQRSTNGGLAALSLNALLNQAAQNKANDMVARDYWSHNTPDGQTPWSFYAAVGYNYQTAGENLAYGFDSAANTITGWMNSPGHRANILNTTYQEVGFGIANSPNFQGTGPETIVVAEYAEPVGAVTPIQASSPAIPATSQPVASSPASAAPTSTSTTPTSDATPTIAEQPTSANENQAVVPTTEQLKPITESSPKSVSRVEQLTAGKAAWSTGALSLLLASGFLIFFMRHGIAWHKFIKKGEKFVLKHPWLDVAVTACLVAGLLLIGSTGVIR